MAVIAPHALSDTTRGPWLFRVLGALLRPWLKIKTEPPEPAAAMALDEAPVCYMLDGTGSRTR